MSLNIHLLPPGRAASAVRVAALGLALLATAAGALGAQQQEGDRAWDEGRREEAKAAYLQVLENDPGAVRANLRLGLLLAWAGRYDSALVHLARARAADPNDPEARVVEARVLAWSGRLPQATVRYDSVLASDPRNVEALIGLGYVHHWQGRDGPAARTAHAALALDPDNQDARDLRDAVRAATRAALELSANWSNDSDRNTKWWQTAEVSAPVGDGLRLVAGANLLEAHDPIRDAIRAGGEAGFSWAIGDVQFGGAVGAAARSETADPRTVATYRASSAASGSCSASIGYALPVRRDRRVCSAGSGPGRAGRFGQSARVSACAARRGGGSATDTRTWVGGGHGAIARRFFAGCSRLGYDGEASYSARPVQPSKSRQIPWRSGMERAIQRRARRAGIRRREQRSGTSRAAGSPLGVGTGLRAVRAGDQQRGELHRAFDTGRGGFCCG
jgi:tetratricopeptide (TPR) repeat protein